MTLTIRPEHHDPIDLADVKLDEPDGSTLFVNASGVPAETVARCRRIQGVVCTIATAGAVLVSGATCTKVEVLGDEVALDFRWVP